MKNRTPAPVALPLPQWLPRTVWPFHTYAVESRDSLIAVTEIGRGPVLLLAHVGTWSFIWRDLATRLAANFRCIFFDAPGTGLTEDAFECPVTLDRASDAIAAVIRTLDLQDFTLVAHDLAGPAAIAAAGAMPERVRALVGMNAFAWRPSGGALRAMLAIVGNPAMREFDVLTGILPRITASAFGVGRHLVEAERRVFLAGIGSRGRRAFHDYMRDARRCDGLYARARQALIGPLARLPLLTIFGEHNDPFGFQKRWKELFPDARQEVVAKGNHFPMCDAPDFVARTIREWYRDSVMDANGEPMGKEAR